MLLNLAPTHITTLPSGPHKPGKQRSLTGHDCAHCGYLFSCSWVRTWGRLVEQASPCKHMRMREYKGVVGPRLPDEEQVDLAVEVFRMLADATRIKLLWTLTEGEAAVSDLTEAVGRPQALVSQHLAKLRMARLVSTRRSGSHVFYRLANNHVSQLVADAIYSAEHAGPGVPAHHLPDAHDATRKQSDDSPG